ncbi:C-reactive protein [Lepisosteus oculatus]|uniref:Pentraxin family member n=1 Tax=Lepisosteus oculatus TaxID=7918 RepID=W5M5K4_LEPOC|nr:PREDICTED: pentraxin fusion protein-like [Lepisosteus oculatus]
MRLLAEMCVLVAVVLSCLLPLSSASEGLFRKALIFPVENARSYVTLTPQKPLQMSAFTLCMRLSTELPVGREVILFAYRTADNDELNVWREKDGQFSFYLAGDGLMFKLPQLSALGTHMCVTWDSQSGLSAFWVDGKRSARQVYRKGHTIRSEGTILLGQDPDKLLGDFDVTQSFVGEISDVNLWDYVLPASDIQALYTRHQAPTGNVLDWNTIQYQTNGIVLVKPVDEGK